MCVDAIPAVANILQRKTKKENFLIIFIEVSKRAGSNRDSDGEGEISRRSLAGLQETIPVCLSVAVHSADRKGCCHQRVKNLGKRKKNLSQITNTNWDI